MSKQTCVVASALVLLAVGCSGAEAAPGGKTTGAGKVVWEGAVAAGKTVYIRDLNGKIEAVPSSGNKVVVRAVLTTQAGHTPDKIDLVAVPHDGTVTVCALWPAKKRSCKARGHIQHSDVKHSHTSVSFEVLVPKGVAVDLQTVNGSVSTGPLGAQVVATTVNGNVSVETGRGAVSVETVNGNVNATLGSAGGDVSLETVNGSIKAVVPARYDADLDASVVNGRIKSTHTVADARSTKRSLSGRLGKGGRRLSMSTVNGSIAIR